MPTDNHWYCLTGRSCTNETIVQGSGDEFDAYGYKSVAGVKTTITSQEAELYGAYAAQYAQLINVTYQGDCFGYKSCDNVQELIVDQATLQCDGSASCANVGSIYVRGYSYSYEVLCYGDFSCANSVFQDTQVIWGYGAYSLYNTYFNFSETRTNVSIWYSGSYSGVNSSVICNSNGVINCQINCDSNACDGVKLLCHPQIGNCSEFTLRCWSCHQDKLPSYYLYYSNNNTMIPFDIKNDSNSKDKHGIFKYYQISENRNVQCDSQSSYVYDDYNMSLNEAETQNPDDNSVICFRGYYTGIFDTISTLGDESDVVCSGQGSCYGAAINVNGYGSNVFCLGNNGCIYSTVINGTNDKNNTLYCGGKNSCRATDIYNFEHVYITGASACANCDIYGSRNVYFVNYEGGLSSTISSDGNGEMNVHFDGYGSGQSVYVECVMGATCNIYCLTNYACDSSTEVDCRKGTQCNVHCDEAMGCPIVYNTTDTPTFLPTPQPTRSPTTQPTEFGMCDVELVFVISLVYVIFKFF